MNMTRRASLAVDGFEEQARYFKALAHPVRLKIIETLRQGEACVCHLEAMLGLRQAYLSQQLAVLRRAGLLRERKEGQYIFYSLADSGLPEVLDRGRASVVVRMGGRATAFGLPERPVIPGCPCPHCEAAR
jgi:ArsR family transcriptional regulator